MKNSQDDKCAAGETWGLCWECVTGWDVLQQRGGVMTWEIAGLDPLQQTSLCLLPQSLGILHLSYLNHSRAACERHCSSVIGLLFSACDSIAPAGSVGWLDF